MTEKTQGRCQNVAIDQAPSGLWKLGLIFFLLVTGCSASGLPEKKTAHSGPGIIIIDVTDKDIARYGRWPWSRDRHAKALDILNRSDARAVLFDYIFSEEDTRWPDKDRIFSKSIATSKVPVFLPFVFVQEGGREDFPFPVSKIFSSAPEDIIGLDDRMVLPPLKKFQEKAAGVGFINVFPGKDDVLRNLHLVVRWKGSCYPLLDLLIALHLRGISLEEVRYEKGSIHVGSSLIAISPDGSVKPDFGKPFTRYRHFPYSDLLDKKLEEEVRGKLVIMSVRATGLSDFLVTESSNRFPGSEIHAEAVDFILRKLSPR